MIFFIIVGSSYEICDKVLIIFSGNNGVSVIMKLTMTQNSVNEESLYRIHTMQTYSGPLKKKLELESRYMAVNEFRSGPASIKLYTKCKDEDGKFRCEEQNRKYGSEVKCMEYLFNSDGLTSSCQGNNEFIE